LSSPLFSGFLVLDDAYDNLSMFRHLRGEMFGTGLGMRIQVWEA